MPATSAACAAPGASSEMEAAAQAEHFASRLGIGHTRWATHGGVTEGNAHPHVSHGELALVHNGIIENHEEQRERLRELGYEFESQTDTEVIAHLVHHYRAQGDDLLRALQKAVQRTARRVRDRRDRQARSRPHGRRAHGLPAAGRPGRGRELRRLRRLGHRLVDAPRDLPGRRRHRRTHARQRARVRRHRRAGRARRARFRRLAGVARARPVPPLHAEGNPRAAARGGRHHRSGDRQRRLLRRRCSATSADDVLRDIEAVQILACGTSYYAGLVARYWIEIDRRHPVRGRDRQRIPLSRSRSPIRSSSSSPSRSRAKRSTRWKR